MRGPGNNILKYLLDAVRQRGKIGKGFFRNIYGPTHTHSVVRKAHRT